MWGVSKSPQKILDFAEADAKPEVGPSTQNHLPLKSSLNPGISQSRTAEHSI